MVVVAAVGGGGGFLGVHGYGLGVGFGVVGVVGGGGGHGGDVSFVEEAQRWLGRREERGGGEGMCLYVYVDSMCVDVCSYQCMYVCTIPSYHTFS